MTEYGWLVNGEPAFRIENVLIAENYGRPFAEGTWTKTCFQRAYKDYEKTGKKVGVIFIPEREAKKNRYSLMAETATVFGRSSLVPDYMSLVVIVLTPEEKLKVDVHRKITAYACTEVLLDLSYGKDAVYSPDDFRYENEQWHISEKYGQIPDTPYARACSTQAVLEAEELLLDALNGSPLPSIETELEHALPRTIVKIGMSGLESEEQSGTCSTDAEISEFVEHFTEAREAAHTEAHRIYSLLSAGHMPPLKLNAPSSKMILDILASVPAVNGFGEKEQWKNKWKTGFDPSSRSKELKSALQKFYLLPEQKKYVESLSLATEQVKQMRKIWDTMLSRASSPFVLPAKIARPEATDEEKQLASETMKFIADAYGITSALDAYAAGVPLDDIFA